MSTVTFTDLEEVCEAHGKSTDHKTGVVQEQPECKGDKM